MYSGGISGWNESFVPFKINIFMNDYTNITYEFHMCDNRNPKFQKFYEDGIKKLVERWEDVIDKNGDYADD